MGASGCRCLVDARRSTRVHRRHRQLRRLSRQARLGLATALAIPALALTLASQAAPSPGTPPPAASAAGSPATNSPVTMSSCAVNLALCEVEVDSAALPDQASVRLTDGPLSIAPMRVIGVTMVVHPTAHGRGRRPEMLHAYFRLPRRHGRHWQLMVEAKHHPRRSFDLPTAAAPTGAL